MSTSPPSEDQVWDALREVIDPEVGVNIVDLGLVYGIEISPDGVHVRMTMTTPACPMGAVITDSVCEAVGALAPDSEQVEVELVWDPPWHPGLMSDGARTVFGW